jgi:hypothetical protein
VAKFRIKRQSIRKVEVALKNKKASMQRKVAFALAVWADDTVGAIKAEIIRVRAFDTGMLHGSIQRSAPQLIGTKLRIVIFSPLEYASIVEFGRKPGKKPPLHVLVGWAKRNGLIKALPVNVNLEGQFREKLIAARAIRKKMKRTRTKTGRSKPITDRVILDFLILLGIQDAIGRKGVKGRKPVSRVVDQRAKTLRRDIIRTVKTLA